MSRKWKIQLKLSLSSSTSLSSNFASLLLIISIYVNNKRLICTKAIFISLSHHRANSYIRSVTRELNSSFGGFHQTNKKKSLTLDSSSFFCRVLKSFGLILRLSCVVCFWFTSSRWSWSREHRELAGDCRTSYTHFYLLRLHSKLFLFLFSFFFLFSYKIL